MFFVLLDTNNVFSPPNNISERESVKMMFGCIIFPRRKGNSPSAVIEQWFVCHRSIDH